MDRLTGHGARDTPLIGLLAEELSVSIRRHWTPDALWIAGYKKTQLADLIGKLHGPAHGSAALNRKKSELGDELAELFQWAEGAPDTIGDLALATTLKEWIPYLHFV